jgi:hypothetical protein
MIVEIFFISILFSILFVRLLKIEQRISKIEKVNQDQNIAILKLIYHKCMELEDYESVNTIKKALPKDTNFDKF